MQEHLSPSLELAVLQSRTLPQLVQQDILSGELRAGERVNEVEIARRLGVSRGRIRDGGAKAAGRAMQKHILASSARMQKALRVFHIGKAANQNAGHRVTQSGTRLRVASP